MLLCDIFILFFGFLFFFIMNFRNKEKKECLCFKVNAKQSLVDTLVSTINMKVKTNMARGKFVPLNVYNTLGFVDAPVYLIKGRDFNFGHMNLYRKALEKIDYKLNVVIIDKKIKINNKNINLIIKNSKLLKYDEISMINALNINYKIEKSKKDKINLEKLKVELGENSFTFNAQKGEVKELILPQSTYGYCLEKKKNLVIVYDVFKTEILELSGYVKANIISNKLILNITKNSKIFIKLNLTENELKIIEILKLNIKCEKYQKNIEKLKENAILSLKNNIFLIKNKINNIKINNLSKFFKLTNLRKNYLNDYLFLIKNIFGISINNFILMARPTEVIDNDFSIEYDWGGEVRMVNFRKQSGDEIHLNYVGHKMGQVDKCVFGF